PSSDKFSMDFGEWTEIPTTIRVRSSGSMCTKHHYDDMEVINNNSLDPRFTYFVDDTMRDVLPSMDQIKKFIEEKRLQPKPRPEYTPTRDVHILCDNSREMQLMVEMPRLGAKDKVEAFVNNDNLAVMTGVKIDDGEDGDCRWNYYRQMKLSFYPSAIRAKIEDGVMIVTIFKKEEQEGGVITLSADYVFRLLF
ncbi:hypothetical protein FRX31_011375, partial [Thalictrum thalictroides]